MLLKRQRAALDGSPPGTGKTHIVSFISDKYDMPVVAIGPGGVVEEIWNQAITDYDLLHYDLPHGGPYITYESLRATSRRQPKHGLLMRRESSFYPTPLLDELIKGGTLFVFDEIQALKNKTMTLEASVAIVRRVMASENNSWVMFLSGSPFEKEEHVQNLLRAFQIMKSDYFYTNYFGNLETDGFDEIVNWVSRFDREGMDAWLAEHPFVANAKTAKHYLYRLYADMVSKELMSIMPKVLDTDEDGNPKASLDMKNGFYKMKRREMICYTDVVKGLGAHIHYDPGTNAIMIEAGGMAGIVNRLRKGQEAKIPIIVRLVEADLKDSHKKVVIFSDYFTVIDGLMEKLAKYNPRRLVGKVSKKDRNKYIAKFNEPNDESRILIINTKVGAKSINLQDLTGKFPRMLYLMPSYKINDLHQASLRTFRIGSVGLCFVRFIYGLGLTGETEQKLLDALAKKGQILGEIMRDQNVIFPGQHENEVEEAELEEDEIEFSDLEDEEDD